MIHLTGVVYSLIRSRQGSVLGVGEQLACFWVVILRICQAASAYKALQPPAEYACLLIGKGKTTTARVPCSAAPTESGGQDETAPAGVWCSAPKWGERRLGVTAKALPCVTSISRTESPSALRRSPSCYLILHDVCSVWPAARPKM
jgi:hypothetical protein